MNSTYNNYLSKHSHEKNVASNTIKDDDDDDDLSWPGWNT